MMSVPTIDIGPYFDGGKAARQAVARQIGDACETIGFFSIVGHPVPQPLIDQTFETAAAFYDQPQEVKDAVKPDNSAAARGYHRLGTKNLAKTLGYDNPPDLREQFYIGPLQDWSAHYARFPEAAFLYAPNIWPETPRDFRPVFSAYYGALEALSKDLMRLFALALDLDEGFFDNKIDKHFATLPANDYPALGYDRRWRGVSAVRDPGGWRGAKRPSGQDPRGRVDGRVHRARPIRRQYRRYDAAMDQRPLDFQPAPRRQPAAGPEHWRAPPEHRLFPPPELRRADRVSA